MIDTADGLITALGGTTSVAGLLGVSLSTASTWRVRGLPAWTCDRLSKESAARGLDVDPVVFEIRPRVVRASD